MAVAKWSESLNDGQRLMLPLIQISDVLGLIQILSSNKGSIINCFTILYNHGDSARVCVLLQGTTREKNIRGKPKETHGYLQISCCLQAGKPETWNIISLNAFHTRVASLHLEGPLLPWIWKEASENNLSALFPSRKGRRAEDSERNGEVRVMLLL